MLAKEFLKSVNIWRT